MHHASQHVEVMDETDFDLTLESCGLAREIGVYHVLPSTAGESCGEGSSLPQISTQFKPAMKRTQILGLSQ